MQPDLKWNERLQKAHVNSNGALVIDYAAMDKQRAAFLKGNDPAPNMVYKKLDDVDCDAAEEALLSLLSDVRQYETVLAIKRAYEWRILEDLGHVRLVRAAQNGDDLEVARLSKATYGIPQYEVLTHILLQLEHEIAEIGDDVVKKEAAKRLKEELQFDLIAYSPIDVAHYPIPEVTKDPRQDLCTAEEVAAIFRAHLDDLGFDDWQVVIDHEKTRHAIATNYTRNTIFIPDQSLLHEGRVRPLTHRQTTALAAHEVGVHVRRRKSGEKSPLALLHAGFDRSLEGEEGLAVWAEQRITGANDFARSGRYLSIALALGIDGTPRNFREVYEIMRDVYTVRSSSEGEEARKKAEDIAWKLCIRIFKGTSGATRGACFTKDIAYRQGNINIWELVRANSREVERFFVGRYNPANPRHRWILDELGITGGE